HSSHSAVLFHEVEQDSGSRRYRSPATFQAPNDAPKTFPLLTEGSNPNLPLGKRYEPTHRPRPRNSRSSAAEDPRPAAAARVGDQPSPEIHLERRAAGQRRLALPRAPQAGAGGLDPGGVEADGEQPASEVLLAHPSGPAPAGIRSGELE